MTYEEPNVKDRMQYSVAKTASVLEIDRTTVYRHIRKGKLLANIIRANGRTVISGANIKRFWHKEMLDTI
ncbi:hypothetical protein FACS1894178_9380 [Bacteroidia bacterium]|nr:hypothetical protein FACS1894178_9380 [Bacteroidia bacterium]